MGANRPAHRPVAGGNPALRALSAGVRRGRLMTVTALAMPPRALQWSVLDTDRSPQLRHGDLESQTGGGHCAGSDSDTETVN